MKKTLFIIVIFALGFSTMAEAQIIVNSTQAMTLKRTSSREKGLVFRPEIGVGVYDDPGINLRGNLGYQFNPYITLGGGLGVEAGFYSSDHNWAFPFYVDVKGYFSNRVWSPYYNINLGYLAHFMKDPSSFIDSRYGTNSIYLLGGGFYFSTTLGINYKNFDFGIEISTLGEKKYGYKSDDYNPTNKTWSNYYLEYDYYYPLEYLSLKLKFGYNFPVNAKKK